jgi:hypothetical protein
MEYKMKDKKYPSNAMVKLIKQEITYLRLS